MNDLDIPFFDFKGEAEGPNVVISGRIHGNEPAGTLAIERFLSELKAGKWKILKGSVRFIPVCNPRAMRENKRFSEINLNRVFEPNANPKLYEEKLAQVLLPMLKRRHCH